MRYFDLVYNVSCNLFNDFKSNDDHDRQDSFREFLIYNSKIDQEDGIGTTHLFIEKNESTDKEIIIGFYTLRCSSLIIGSEDGKKLGEPALEIAEFAVHKNYERTGVGTTMMKNIFATAINLNQTMLGIKHLVLCSVEDAIGFYSSDNFRFKKIANGEQIPQEIRNLQCTPMSVRIPKLKTVKSL